MPPEYPTPGPGTTGSNDDASARSLDPPPLPPIDRHGPFPQPFGRYIVEEWLGGGGMANVFRATDTVLDIEVALKVPLAAILEHAVARVQFLHEARAGSRLDHPHICRVLDFGHVGAMPYLTMQYIAGNPLSHYRPADQPLWDQWDAAGLVHTLALALAVAHGQGIIHRDLKPSNILMTPEGKPVITDFGLALRLNRAEAQLPEPGQIAGTIPYMPPEQINVGTGPIGPAGDIYSLGVVLFELLTGQVPFRGSDALDTVRRILHHPLRRPSEVRSGVHPSLDAICLKALAKDARQRFICMEEFAEALARSLGGDYLLAPEEAAAIGNERPRVAQEAIAFAFAGYGERAPAVVRDRLYLDMGNELRAGVIDHHQLVGGFDSTTRLVLNRADLLDAAVAPGRSAGERFTIVVHEYPDLDSVTAAYLATSYLCSGRFPSGADLLAAYVDRVDEGSLGMSLTNPFSLYAAYQRLANRPAAQPAAGNAAHWKECMRAGMTLLAHVLTRVVQEREPLLDVDAFACPGLFSPEDRQAVAEDMQRYEQKLADPLCQARRAHLRLPGQFGGIEEVEALLIRDVAGETDPQRSLFFKDWARSDQVRAANGWGFIALSVFQSEEPGHKRRCILSVIPDSRASLRGLGQLLDEAESRRRREVFGQDDRLVDPVTGAALRPRPGYANADPWYDGRAHGYTIVDAPRLGTLLTADEIEAVFLGFGGWTGPMVPDV